MSKITVGRTGSIGIFEAQAILALDQAAPVQNTWYDIVPETNNCRVYMVGVNVEDANETLEFRITVDGLTSTRSWAATHSTTYLMYWSIVATAGTNDIFIREVANSSTYTASTFISEGRSVQLEVRKTTANGAGNLMGVARIGVLGDA